MEYLPEFIINPLNLPPQVFDTNVIAEYDNFRNMFRNSIGICMAVLVNNSIVFNNYMPYTPIHSMLNNIVRENIINHPEQLISEIFNINADGYILLYMNNMFINIDYNYIQGTFTVTYHAMP
jgi:hypothetical protein